MTVRLRAESNDDDVFLRSLIRTTIAEELRASSWPEILRERIVDIQYKSRRLRGGVDTESLIVLVDDARAGWLYLATAADHLRVVEIMLTPEQRGHGAGSALMREVKRRALRERKPVRLQVNVENTRAARFYERLGFAVLGGDQVQRSMEFPVQE